MSSDDDSGESDRTWCRVCGMPTLRVHEHLPFKERVKGVNIDKHSLLPHDIELREQARRKRR